MIMIIIVIIRLTIIEGYNQNSCNNNNNNNNNIYQGIMQTKMEYGIQFWAPNLALSPKYD